MNITDDQVKVKSCPLVSVIIVNYNGEKYLENCLSSLALQNSEDFEVFVIDNASPDGSGEDACTKFPNFHFIQLKSNKGYPAAVNTGIRNAKGEYILALNNDTVLGCNFVAHIRSAMDTDPSVGMCASKMIFPDGRINSTGICISLSGAAWDRGIFQSDRGQFDLPGEVFGPCGGAALYRREMLDEIGYFDEDFFLYMEDVDVAFRARLAGWRCVYEPQAVVTHHHGGSAGYHSDLSIYYGNRNILWYVFKDFPLPLLLVFSPIIVCRNIGAIGYYLLQGKGMTALKAKYDGCKKIGGMIKKRRKVIRKVGCRELLRYFEPWNKLRAE